jgi:hypothetical protein
MPLNNTQIEANIAAEAAAMDANPRLPATKAARAIPVTPHAPKRPASQRD